MSFLSCLPITDAVIRQQVRTSDGAGGSKLTWSIRVSAYKCRIYSTTGMIEIKGSGQNILITDKCIGEYNSGITEGDMLVVNNMSYRIMHIDRVYDGQRIHHLEMKLKRENIDFA